MPCGVPMKSAQPLRSDSAGWMMSFHTSGLICATSSMTTPSRRTPRIASGLSPPKIRIIAPLCLKRTHSSPSFTSTASCWRNGSIFCFRRAQAIAFACFR